MASDDLCGLCEYEEEEEDEEYEDEEYEDEEEDPEPDFLNQLDHLELVISPKRCEACGSAETCGQFYLVRDEEGMYRLTKDNIAGTFGSSWICKMCHQEWKAEAHESNDDMLRKRKEAIQKQLDPNLPHDITRYITQTIMEKCVNAGCIFQDGLIED